MCGRLGKHLREENLPAVYEEENGQTATLAFIYLHSDYLIHYLLLLLYLLHSDLIIQFFSSLPFMAETGWDVYSGWLAHHLWKTRQTFYGRREDKTFRDSFIHLICLLSFSPFSLSFMLVLCLCIFAFLHLAFAAAAAVLAFCTCCLA